MQKRIKIIIFDLGGVLVESSRLNVSEEVAKIIKVEFKDFLKSNENFYNLTVTGELSLLDYYKKTLEILDIKNFTPQELLARHLEVYDDNFKINNEVINIINKLSKSKKYKLISLTNTEKEIAQRNRIKSPIFNYFKINYLSIDLGLMKPNLDIYEYVIDDMKANPYEMIFIDDKEENLIPAKKLGMKVIHFKNPEQLEKELTSLLS